MELIAEELPLNAEVFFNGKSIGITDKKITYAPADDYSVKFVYQKRELAEKFALQPDETILLTADFTKGEILKSLPKLIPAVILPR